MPKHLYNLYSKQLYLFFISPPEKCQTEENLTQLAAVEDVLRSHFPQTSRKRGKNRRNSFLSSPWQCASLELSALLLVFLSPSGEKLPTSIKEVDISRKTTLCLLGWSCSRPLGDPVILKRVLMMSASLPLGRCSTIRQQMTTAALCSALMWAPRIHQPCDNDLSWPPYTSRQQGSRPSNDLRITQVWSMESTSVASITVKIVCLSDLNSIVNLQTNTI